VIKIAITQAAFEAISATLPFGTVDYENEVNEKGERYIAQRGRPSQGHARPGESYSDVILRCGRRIGRPMPGDSSLMLREFGNDERTDD
jgi:hypothetical protein